jgi:hypothetical protein
MEVGQPEKGARRFDELWVWQQARELVKEIYEDFVRDWDRKISAFGTRFSEQEFRL